MAAAVKRAALGTHTAWRTAQSLRLPEGECQEVAWEGRFLRTTSGW